MREMKEKFRHPRLLIIEVTIFKEVLSMYDLYYKQTYIVLQGGMGLSVGIEVEVAVPFQAFLFKYLHQILYLP